MFCSFSFSKIIKIAFKGIKETDYLKYCKWLKAKISQNLSHKSTIEKKTNKQKRKQAGAVSFFWYIQQPIFLWNMIWSLYSFTLFTFSNFAASISFSKLIFSLWYKKQSFTIKEVVSVVFLQFTHMVPKNLSKCRTYMIKAIKTRVC